MIKQLAVLKTQHGWDQNYQKLDDKLSIDGTKLQRTHDHFSETPTHEKRGDRYLNTLVGSTDPQKTIRNPKTVNDSELRFQERRNAVDFSVEVKDGPETEGVHYRLLD